jgi:peptidyl-prolyl cis-trans isomerase D
MPVILFSLLIAFLLLIVLEWGMDIRGVRGGGHAEVVGTIDGKKIAYRDFEEAVRNVSESQRAQSNADLDDTQLKQIRDQVWQTMVTQQLVEQEIKRLGITVTDQEIVDWVRGDNPPEELRRYFIDSTGQFRKDLYEQVLSNPNQYVRDPRGADPSYGSRWLAEMEKNLRLRRAQDKLQSLLLASVRVGEGEIRQRYADQHQQYDALYALVDPNTLVKDEEIQLTDSDLRAYYEENLDQYKVEAVRKLAYVQFLETPSAADSMSVEEEITDAASKARSGMDFFEISSTYADRPDSGVYFKHGELAPALEAPLFAAKVGSVVGPLLDNGAYYLFKILEERKSDKEYIRASHILFALDEQGDSNAIKAQARHVATLARGGKPFAELAREYSKDPGSAQKGGDLGWFTRGRMVKPFEDAAFGAPVGSIVGPVRSSFGLHVIKVTGRDSRELKISTIKLPIVASSRTKNDIFEQARDFTYNAQHSQFAKEARAFGFEVKETQVREKGGMVPGIGLNESITRWAFDQSVGTVSEPFTIPRGYVVMSIADASDAGVKPFEEVKESIRPLALRKKKLEKAEERAAQLKAELAPSDSLWKVNQLDPRVKVQRTGTFTLGGSVPGAGRDPNFLGAVSGLAIGEISPPVKSVRGAYLIQLLSKTPFDSVGYQQQYETLRTQLLQEKRNRFLTDWLAKLKENADIQDNRDKIYRQ